jgi:ribosomal protein S18 acetylase RimI-like enzyme
MDEAARVASAADMAAVVTLARALRAELRALRGGALWADYQARPEPLEQSMGALLGRDDACIVVGTIDESIIGYGTVEIVELRDGRKLGVIAELFVDTAARAVGVGEAIANVVIAFCKDAGCLGIDAYALPGNREAKNFFERSGFTARELTMHHKL